MAFEDFACRVKARLSSCPQYNVAESTNMSALSEHPQGVATASESTPAGQRTPTAAIPDHQLLHWIGGGSYGEVWLTRNALGAYRAAKIIHRKSFEDARPFEREFKGIQKFEPISRSHEGLVDILQVGRHSDYFYYVMELADAVEPRGEDGRLKIEDSKDSEHISRHPPSSILDPQNYVPKTLRAVLKERARLPPAECVDIALALTSALAHLHKHGLVHRDIKPSNIIFVQGAPKLADIGLVTDADTTLSYVGTEGYIPPEGPGAAQADIFSLGKVLYEISTGQDRRQFPDLPPNLNEWPDQADVLELNEVLIKACARDARCRYQSCDEMHTDLTLLQRGKSVKRKRALHHWLAVGKKTGLAVSLLSVVVAAVVFLRQSPRDPYLHSAIPEVNWLVEQGNKVVQERTPERVRTALGYFNEAIQLDPNFVPARVGVFRALVIGGGAQRGAPDEVRREMRAVAKKLMEMDSNLAEARAASSMIMWLDWQFPEARAEARLAAQKPAASKEGEGTAHTYYGWFLSESGKPDDALEQYRLAFKKSPYGSIIQHHLGHSYFVKRDFEQALMHYRESLKLADRQGTAHYWIGRVYLEQTNFMAAIQEFEEADNASGRYTAEKKVFYDELREAVRQDSVKGYWSKRLELALQETQPNLYEIATLYARLGNKPEAYTYLREACEKKAFEQGLMFDLCWDHNDQEFIAIAKGIHLLE